jgi:putative spermidine/putrescine transport system permease protein
MMARLNPAAAFLAACTILVGFLLYSPLFVPIMSSFFVVNHGQVDWSQPTLQAYAALAGNREIINALKITLLVGLCTIVLSVTLGTLLALYHHGRGAGRSLLQFIVYLPFLMPPVISGLALLIFFRETGIERSLLTVVIGHTVFVLAIVYRTVLTRLQSISRTLIEASYDLGANQWQTFWRIILPNLTSAMVGGAILAFALSFDETMITILVTGTQTTLPVRLWAMMRLGFSPDINALVTLVLVFTIVMCVLAAHFLVPRAESERPVKPDRGA